MIERTSAEIVMRLDEVAFDACTFYLEANKVDGDDPDVIAQMIADIAIALTVSGLFSGIEDCGKIINAAIKHAERILS